MSGRHTKVFSFASGAVRQKDLGYLIAVQDSLVKEKKPHAAIFQVYRGKWSQGVVKWSAVSGCVAQKPAPQFIAIGEWGDVYVLGSGEEYEEKIRDGKEIPEKRGTLRCVRAIEGIPYAAGMDRQVYRRESKNTWTCIDSTMRPKVGSRQVIGFESIDGFSKEDIYAVGWDGCIWHFDGNKWKEIDSPTNRVLTSVCCAGDGHVYAAGQSGVILRGRGKRWDLIDQGEELNFFDTAWYRDMLYVASLRVLFGLRKNKFKPIDFGEDMPETTYRLSAADGVLWSIGPKDIMTFDGKEWSRIE